MELTVVLFERPPTPQATSILAPQTQYTPPTALLLNQILQTNHPLPAPLVRISQCTKKLKKTVVNWSLKKRTWWLEGVADNGTISGTKCFY